MILRQSFCPVFFSFILLLAFTTPAIAAHPDSKSEIENLKQRIEQLEQQRAADEAEKPSALRKMELPKIRLSGLLELEGNYVDADETSSDLSLATLQLGAESDINENVNSHVILLWEEDGSRRLEVDEAVITLICPKQYAGGKATFSGGKMYLPFGKYSSAMISDPLTLELGETNKTAALFGFGSEKLSAHLGFFNGDFDEAGDNDQVDSWVLSIEAAPSADLKLGVSAISDLAESDNELLAPVIAASYSHSVAGAGGFLSWESDKFKLDLEYITALRSFQTSAPGNDTDLTGRRPSALSAEVNWRHNKKWLFAIRAEVANDFKENDKRIGATATYGLYDDTLLALEFLQEDAQGSAASQTVTAQLAVEF